MSRADLVLLAKQRGMKARLLRVIVLLDYYPFVLRL
jgi:hypothetical protein